MRLPHRRCTGDALARGDRLLDPRARGSAALAPPPGALGWRIDPDRAADCACVAISHRGLAHSRESMAIRDGDPGSIYSRSEEHTSELQSQSNLVCRLLLEKKK